MGSPLDRLEEAVFGERHPRRQRPELVWREIHGEDPPPELRALLRIRRKDADIRGYTRKELDEAGVDFGDLLRALAGEPDDPPEPDWTPPQAPQPEPAAAPAPAKPAEPDDTEPEPIHPFKRRPKEL